MRRWTLGGLLLGLALAPAAWGQVGTVNPNTVPLGVAPFGSSPHGFNNPHPSMPNAGPEYSATFGTPVRRHWVPPQPVVLNIYVPGPGNLPGEYRPASAEIPGYFVTETTRGFLYPERWTIVQPNAGVYQWVRVPQQFRPK